MKPLSERYDAITGQHIINGEIVRKNVTPEVAQLEAENEALREYIRNPESWILRAESERKVSNLKVENEALIDALNHCGYDPDDCIDCGGPPHNEWCRFWKVRHFLSYWDDDTD